MGKPVDPRLRQLGQELDQAQREQLEQSGHLSRGRQRFLLGDPGARQEMLRRMGEQVDQAQQVQLEQRRDLAQVRARLLAPSCERRQTGRLVWAAGVGAAAAAVFILALVSRPDPALTFTIDQKPGRVGQWLSVAPTNKPAVMAFSDGSTLRLESGSGSRVAELGGRGARVALEQGVMQVSVKPRQDNRWVLDVGPFVVRVEGTKFQVAWDLKSKHFSLRMDKGKVRVNGPTMGQRVMNKGDSVDVWVAQQRMVLKSGDGVAIASSGKAEPQATASNSPGGASASKPARSRAGSVTEGDLAPPMEPSVQVPASSAVAARTKKGSRPGRTSSPRRSPGKRPQAVSPSVPRVGQGTPPSRATEPSAPSTAATPMAPSPEDQAAAAPKPPPTQAPETPSAPPPAKQAPAAKPAAEPWSLAQAGDYARALEVASERGWSEIMATAQVGQLSLLAKAARVQGTTNLTVKLFETIRTRFPGTSHAWDAAYFLGLVSVHKLGDHRAAAGWFSRYLQEHPGGPLARAAHGRLVESLHRSGQKNSACKSGREYLSTYPDGPHLRYVRRVLLGCVGADSGKSR